MVPSIRQSMRSPCLPVYRGRYFLSQIVALFCIF
nr:MAG TPA: hypothetical protein [Caudoviricetes sp.]